MHKSTWLFQEYLIRLSQKESYTTYLRRLQSHQDLTPPNLWWKSNLNWHTLLVVSGDKRNCDGLSISLLLYLLVELVLCLLSFFFFSVFVLLWESLSGKSDIYLHLFQGRGKEDISFLADTCRFVGLLTGFMGSRNTITNPSYPSICLRASSESQ